MKARGFLIRLPKRASYICNNCLLRSALTLSSSATLKLPTKRLYSTTKIPSAPPSTGFTILPSRRIISLSGPDSTHFLQGAITANISPTISCGSGFYTVFLNAQGRLLNDVFIYPQMGGGGIEGWYIEVDAKEAEKLVKHVKRYKLRAKFEVKLVAEGEMEVWSLWDAGADGWTAYSMGGAAGTDADDGMKQGGIGCEDKRAPGMGRRLLLPAGRKPEVDMEETSEDAYQVRRYLKGVPEGQDELVREHALPQESNIDFMGGIDYHKGCYVGQELTIRTHHTGVVRKRILPVMLYGKDEETPKILEYLPRKELGTEGIPGETSFGRHEKRGRSAGKWLKGVGNLGLGLCRLEIMTDVLVQGEAGGYKDGDEFKLEWEVEGGSMETVKAKAFVPPWHLTKQ